ncbi:hypothetical protein ZYGR_0AT00110, partial [Zygosaccharomyces rouxii]
MRVTEDQGRSWKLLSLPEEIEDKKPCYLQTHPFNRNFLLLHCGITRESQDSPSFKEDVAYASDDAGKSFRRIVAPADEGENAPDLQYRGTTCLFATSSKESTLDKDGIYCVHKLGRKPTIEKQLSLPFSLPYDIDPIKKAFIEATYLDPELYAVGSVFYTRDLGQSTILFDELKSFSVKDMYILPYHILIITSEENDDENTAKRLWVSRGGPFKPAQLPKGAVFSPNNIPKVLSYDPERISLYADVEENEGHGKFKHLLVSDPSGLEFSFFDSITQEPSDNVNLEKLDNLKGTIWGRFSYKMDLNRNKEFDIHETNLDEKINWFQKIIKFIKKHIFYRKSYPQMEGFPRNCYDEFSTTKGSFDNGKTWTNLKVVDPSGKHKHRFHCDIDDVEHCSFQE